jgi:hypothetical protein
MDITPDHLAAAMRVADLLAQTPIIANAVKSVETLADDYEVQITEAAADVFNGDSTSSTFAAKLRALIKRDAEDMYQQVLDDNATEEKSDDEQMVVDGWIADQLDFVDGFAEDVVKARRVNSPDDYTDRQAAIFARAATWAQSLTALAGKLNALMKENVMGTWKLGATEVHCEKCSWLDGQRHRLKWFTKQGYIPREPGSQTLTCGGWRCDCGIEDDDGNQLL